MAIDLDAVAVEFVLLKGLPRDLAQQDLLVEFGEEVLRLGREAALRAIAADRPHAEDAAGKALVPRR